MLCLIVKGLNVFQIQVKIWFDFIHELNFLSFSSSRPQDTYWNIEV